MTNVYLTEKKKYQNLTCISMFEKDYLVNLIVFILQNKLQKAVNFLCAQW